MLFASKLTSPARNDQTHAPRPEEPCEARRLEGWPRARPSLWPSCETRALKSAGADFDTMKMSKSGRPDFGAHSSESDSIVMHIFSSPCETSREHANAREHDPRLGASDCHLEVLGEATAAVEPSEGSFDHPPLRLCPEGADALRSCDDLDGPLAEVGDRVEQLVAAVDTVSKDMPQFGEGVA